MKKIIIYLFLISSIAYFSLNFKDNIVVLFTKNPYNSYIDKYSVLFDVDALLIKIIMKRESNLNPNAVSNRGSMGLMQLMPKTAFEIAEQLGITDYSYEKIKETKINIMFGVYYLKKLLKHYNNNLILTLAAYNAGIGNVDNWYRENPKINKKIHAIPFKETKYYVRYIVFTYKTYRVLCTIKHQFKLLLSEGVKKLDFIQPILKNQLH
jgi:soluble lytic murein transglycosylase